MCRAPAIVLLAFLAAWFSQITASAASKPYGLTVRPESKGFLQMPPRADGLLPPQLSGTGAFADPQRMVASGGLIPYDLIVPFWSDGAEKARWISVPTDQRIQFTPTGEWSFPR